MITVWNKSNREKAIKVKGGFETVKSDEIKLIDCEMTDTTKESFASQKVIVEDGDKVKKLERQRAKDAAADEVDPEVSEKEAKEAELEKLRARAEELGIKITGNWGIPKLTHEIQEAEKKLAAENPEGSEGDADEEHDDDDDFLDDEEGDGEEE